MGNLALDVVDVDVAVVAAALGAGPPRQ